MDSQSFEVNIGGRNLRISTGKLAGQANASATVTYGETVILVTACYSKEVREGIDFLPLTVDYEERLYAAGKIPGGFIRREGRPSEHAVLACRLTDRPVRPLINKGWHNDTQLITTVLSADQENDPDVLAVIGASAALTMSEIPFDGPIGVVNVGYINNEMVLNPTLAQLEESELDLVVASTSDRVIMLEARASEVQEDIVTEAIKFGHEANQDIIRLQEQMREAVSKPKIQVSHPATNPELASAVAAATGDRLAPILKEAERAKRDVALSEIKQELKASIGESFSEEEIRNALEAQVKAQVRSNILDNGWRLGGRGITEIRPISCEVGILPRTHGSGLFTRGQTQVLTITTLGSTKKEQMLDGLGIEESKRFIHHYNFTPFSTGEVKRSGSPGRREIGHGALAERALSEVLPRPDDFPYTIRLVSEVLSSSGSTSMASVCAGSLSLMDAGVPIKAAVAGVAMGLVTDDSDRFVILTDIEGLEDAYGDMDFKVAGTKDGITAIQMDTKIKGLTMEMVAKTLVQAREGRLFILDKMDQTIGTSRSEVNRYAPRMQKIMIDPAKIGAVIGAGGKTIRSITEDTKATIDIENDGTVIIGSNDEEAAKRAIAIIESLTKEIEVGETYTGKVTRILDFGAMVEVLPGKEGLVHISELADYRVPSVEDVVKVGDEVTVKVIGIDNMGRVNLSRRAVFDDSSGSKEAAGSSDPNYPFKRSSNRPPQQRNNPYGGDRPRRDNQFRKR